MNRTLTCQPDGEKCCRQMGPRGTEQSYVTSLASRSVWDLINPSDLLGDRGSRWAGSRGQGASQWRATDRQVRASTMSYGDCLGADVLERLGSDGCGNNRLLDHAGHRDAPSPHPSRCNLGTIG